MVRHTKSAFTKIGWYLILISVLVEFMLSLTYIGSIDPDEVNFGFLTLIESSFGFIGLISIDLLRTGKIEINPRNKKFRDIEFNSVIGALILVLTMEAIQFIAQVIISVRDFDKATAMIFAAPVEEVFFRGFLITIFMFFSNNMPKSFDNLPKITVKQNGRIRNITIIDVLGLFMSATLFMLFHVNYYGNIGLLIAVFANGLVLGGYYLYTDDLFAVIMAHLFVNVVNVMVIFGGIGSLVKF